MARFLEQRVREINARVLREGASRGHAWVSASWVCKTKHSDDSRLSESAEVAENVDAEDATSLAEATAAVHDGSEPDIESRELVEILADPGLRKEFLDASLRRAQEGQDLLDDRLLLLGDMAILAEYRPTVEQIQCLYDQSGKYQCTARKLKEFLADGEFHSGFFLDLCVGICEFCAQVSQEKSRTSGST